MTYRCSRCQTALQARSSLSTSWLKCPKCERPSLPPAEPAWKAERPEAGWNGSDELYQIDDPAVEPTADFRRRRHVLVVMAIVGLSGLAFLGLGSGVLDTALVVVFGFFAVPIAVLVWLVTRSGTQSSDAKASAGRRRGGVRNRMLFVAFAVTATAAVFSYNEHDAIKLTVFGVASLGLGARLWMSWRRG